MGYRTYKLVPAENRVDFQSSVEVGENRLENSFFKIILDPKTGAIEKIYDKLKRIDISNRVLKDSTPLLEIYFAFPFSVEEPTFKFEGSNSVIEPLFDQFEGANTDAYAVQHWVDVSKGDFGVTLSSIEAPVVEFSSVSDAHRGVTPPRFEHEFPKHGELKRGHLYSYVMVNNFRTNFQPVQVGDVLFRYSIRTHSGDWKEGKARDFGWAFSNPLIPVCMNGRKDGILPTSISFCRVDRPNVLILTLKRAEDKNGFIFRLIETEGKDTTATLEIPFLTISQAYQTNLVEENERILTHGLHDVKISLNGFGILTLRVISERI
ncbi:TPA: hypothetical protein EYP66_16495 [Candidatus Poribacteria bacterium]|nr:hypothetical protein [Candidatus Poribacteria bacterium]